MTGAVKTGAKGLVLFVRVTPNASKDAIGGLWRGAGGDERLALRVTAPPDKGRANAAARKLIAKALGLPKSAVSLVAGDKDRLKSFSLGGDSDEIIGHVEALLKGREAGESS